MCGISGVFLFKKLAFQDCTNIKAFLRQAAYVGSLRGRDSTGMMVLDRKSGQTSVVKQAIDGALFIDKFNVDRVVTNVDEAHMLVFHNRKATFGGTNDANAHPFKCGPITLVHNGTVNNFRSLTSENYNVDSAAICHALSEKPAKEVFESLSGAWAIVWHDERNNSLNMCRNDERPLSLAYDKEKDVIYFASEKAMLDWLLIRNDLDAHKFYELKKNVIHSWVLGETGKACTGLDYKTEKYKEKSAVPPQQRGDDWYGKRNNPNYGNVSPINNQSNTSRNVREAHLAKWNLKIGQKIPFVCYDAEKAKTSNGNVNIYGYDDKVRFEIVSYCVKANGNWLNALCEGEVLTIKDTPAFPNWCTVVVTNPVIIQKDYMTGDSPPPLSQPRRESTSASIPANDTEMAEVSSESTPSLSEAGEESSLPKVMVRGPNDRLISIEEWDHRTKYGCSNCSCSLSDPVVTYWTPSGDPLCSFCIKFYPEAYNLPLNRRVQ